MAHAAESQGLPASILECKLCFEVVEKAVHCVRCKKFICERHKANLRECPFCRLVPLKVEVDYTLRDLVDQLPIECSLCHQHITKGELDIHTKHCTQPPRECGVDGCAFQTTNKSEALRHVMAVHGNELWENFKQLTAAVGNGVESVCANCQELEDEAALRTVEPNPQSSHHRVNPRARNSSSSDSSAASTAELPPRGFGAGGKICYFCGRPGHISRECPVKHGRHGFGNRFVNYGQPPAPFRREFAPMPMPAMPDAPIQYGRYGNGYGFGYGDGGVGVRERGSGPRAPGPFCFECGKYGHGTYRYCDPDQ